jgi:hypothetical protein
MLQHVDRPAVSGAICIWRAKEVKPYSAIISPIPAVCRKVAFYGV